MKIEVKNLEISYLSSKGANLVLDNVSFVLKNKINIFIGASGSGKSTLLHLFNLDLLPSSGSLLINNISIDDPSFELKKYKNEIMMVGENFFCPDFSVIDNLALNMSSEIDYEERLKEIKDNFSGNLKLENKYHTLSSGQKLFLILNLAKIKKTSIVLLDEPTANLGEKDIHKAIEYIEDISKISTVIISTNDDKLIIPSASYYHIENKKVSNYDI